MHTALIELELTNQSAEHFVHQVQNLLSPSECQEIIEKQEPFLIPTSGAYSSRLRHMYFDTKLSEILWDRLEQFYGSKQVVDEEGQTWKASHLNTFLRFCKYNPGGVFGPHHDGRRMMTVDQQSFMTVNIYLSTVPSLHGGATRVLDENDKNSVIGRVQPLEGMASVFRDSLFHDGEALKDGVKYLLRTDIIFEREVPFNFESLYGDLSVEEKAIKAHMMAECLEDGGSRDAAIFWYKKAYRLDPALETGEWWRMRYGDPLHKQKIYL